MLSTRFIAVTRPTLKATLKPSIFRYRYLATMSSSSTVTSVITHDHRELEEFYNNIISSTDSDTKIRWQNQFTWELARHSIGEEIVVYPAMEKYVPEGKALADKDREEHQTVSWKLIISMEEVG